MRKTHRVELDEVPTVWERMVAVRTMSLMLGAHCLQAWVQHNCERPDLALGLVKKVGVCRFSHSCDKNP